MKTQSPAVRLAVACALTLSMASIAFAQNLKGDDMKGMDMSGASMGDSEKSPTSATVPPDPGNMKEGEMEAMSGGPEMDHDMHMGQGMKNMSKHMAYTTLRPASAADKARAASIVSDLQRALGKYKDYHAAEAEGFKPFHPEIKNQKVVHFTRNWNALKAAFAFNPDEPTSLLYERTPDGGYKHIGAMYTDRKNASEDQLNERVPLSVARWHRHIDLCFPARGTEMKTADWTKFGFNGSIATKADCDAVNGRFYPQVFGWMVHVYPWEQNPRMVWAR